MAETSFCFEPIGIAARRGMGDGTLFESEQECVSELQTFDDWENTAATFAIHCGLFVPYRAANSNPHRSETMKRWRRRNWTFTIVFFTVVLLLATTAQAFGVGGYFQYGNTDYSDKFGFGAAIDTIWPRTG